MIAIIQKKRIEAIAANTFLFIMYKENKANDAERLQYSDFWLIIVFAGQNWPTAQNDNADNMLPYFLI